MPSRRCRSRQQAQDLRLDGDVERRGRLVGDQDVRLGRRCAIAIIARWRMPPLNWWG